MIVAWTQVALLSELAEGEMKRVELGDDDIAIYHTASGFFATSDVCTHASESLSCGRLEGNIVACPKHGGKFDVTTGQATAFPCVYPLATYELEVRGEALWLNVE